jgi:hypothetical protein
MMITATYCLAGHIYARGHEVTQSVEALNYKLGGRGFDSQWVIGIFHLHNPSGLTMVLESTQPLTEMSTRNISWDKGDRCVGTTVFPPLYA